MNVDPIGKADVLVDQLQADGRISAEEYGDLKQLIALVTFVIAAQERDISLKVLPQGVSVVAAPNLSAFERESVLVLLHVHRAMSIALHAGAMPWLVGLMEHTTRAVATRWACNCPKCMAAAHTYSESLERVGAINTTH